MAAWALCAVASAQTTYTGGPGPADFTLASNWSNNAPQNQNAIVNTGGNAISLFLPASAPNPYSIDSLTVQGTNALTFNQASGTLTVAAAGALNFGTSNSIYNLSGGTLQVGGTNGITGTATVNLGGGTLQVIGSNLTSNTATVLVANTTSTVDSNGFNASLNNTSGSGSLNKIGTGNLNVGGNITWGPGNATTVLGSLDFGTSNATGTVTLNSGSSVAVTGQASTGAGRFQVGYGGTGTLNLAGGTINMTALSANGDFRVGQVDASANTGNGTVNFSSGSIAFNSPNLATAGFYNVLVVGEGLGSTGVFNQSGGSLTGNGLAFEVGVNQGVGTYAMTSQASVVLGTGSTIYVGDSPSGVGLLHVSGNSTLSITSGATFVGTSGGVGTIQQDGTGSVVTFNSASLQVYIGSDSASTGNYDLSAGTLHITSGDVEVGSSAGSTGNLNQTGGTLTSAADVIIGDSGTGTYNLSAGTGTFNGGLKLANIAGSVGTVNLSGTGILQVGGANGIAQGAGTAALNLGGGTIQVVGSALTTSVNANLVTNTQSTVDTNGLGATFSGAITGAGGLIKTGLGDLTVNNANNSIGSLHVLLGNVDQTGGTLAVNGGGLTLAAGTAYNLDSGTLQVGGANGITGIGTLNLGGGTLQVVGSALILNTPVVLVAGTTSTINTTNFAASLNAMSGSGSLNKIGANDLNLGTVVLDAGSTINSVENLNIGTVNAAGNLTLNAGSSVVVTGTGTTQAGWGQLQVGYGGTGTLNLSGGAITMSTLSGNLAIFSVGLTDASGNVGHGTVNFSSGSITLGYAGETDGMYGSLLVGSELNSTGVFNQSGGTVTGNGGVLEIGVNQGVGTYALTNNASLTMGAGSTTYIGDSPSGVGLLHISGNSTYSDGYQTYVGTEGGTGTIQQDGAGSVVTIMTGGANVFFGYTLGSTNPGSTGNYDLSAGTLNFISGAVNFGEDATSTGNLNQTGGTLIAEVKVTLGLGGTGTYNLSSGMGTFNAGLLLASEAGSTGTLNLSGTGILQVGGTNGIAHGLGTAVVNLGGGTIRVIGTALTTSVNATLLANTQSTIDTNNLGATFSGILSGTGALAKASAGTLILSGANGYSGGTTINGGTIQAGSASALGAASGTLNVNNGTFDLHGFNIAVDALNGTTSASIGNTGGAISTLTVGSANGSGTFAGVLADDAALGLIKDGTGTETLTGANTYSGGTQIDEGTLTAGNAAALGMGDVTNSGGVLNAGNGNHAINVNGIYTQLAPATLSLTINSAAAHDDLTVTGTAALGGTLQLYLAPGFVPALNSTIDLVQTGGLNGTIFSNLVISGPEQGILEYTATDVSIEFTSRIFLAQTAGLTPNQSAIAGYIDQFAPTVTTGNFNLLVANIYPLSTNPGALAAALDQISPQSLQIFRSIAFDNATFSSQQLNDHLANLRDGLTGFDGSQLSVIDSTLDPALSQINSRLLAWDPEATPGLLSDAVDPVFGGFDMKDSKDMHTAEAPEPASRWSTFIAGNVVLADLSHTDDTEHQNYTTGSVTLGADYRLDAHFTVGALLAYGHTDATLDHNGSSATVDSYSPGVYASYVDGGWYGNGLFSYGYNSYTEDRNISIGTLNGTNYGAPQGNQFTGNLTGGYEFHRGAWKFGPVASIEYVNLGINSFSEQGPTALNIQNQSDESLRSQFGIEARYALKTGSVILTPHISASWQHEFLDNSEGITSQFNQIGSGSFTVQTANPERDSAFIDLGLDAQVDKELTLFLDYQTEAGQSNFFAQSIQAGLKIGF